MVDNTEQAAYWNGRMGSAWVSIDTYLDNMLRPLSDVAIQAAAAKPGMRILDVGCGCGPTSIQMARQGADVLGVDISEAMIAQANHHAEGIDHVAFSVADAATDSYAGDFDVVFSRFGIMFFADPELAFTNLRSALKPGGRLNVLCWREVPKNPWIGAIAQAIAPFQPDDVVQPDPQDPGPFAFADTEYFSNILTRAGFTDAEFTSVEKPLNMGSTVDEVLQMQHQVGPLSRLLEDVDEATGEAAIDAVRQVLEGMKTSEGIHLPGAAWLVTARNQ